MNLSAYKKSLLTDEPPFEASVYLKSLWYDAKGQWGSAHELIQDLNDKTASWIHGYLHRQEGDISNADYWYKLAGKKRPDISLDKEWEEIVGALIPGN